MSSESIIEPYFTALDEGPEGGTYRAAGHTAGPWHPGLQHGGPPSALLVRAAERCAAAGTGRTDLLALRFGAEFLGPVPVGDVTASARVVRAARTAVLVEAAVTAGDRVCLQGRIWLVRDADTASIAAALPAPEPAPQGLPSLGVVFPYGESIEWQFVTGSMATIGPGVTWARPRCPLVAGEALSGLQRVSLVGDSSSGISSELAWDEWSFVNVDLDVHLSRPVRGEWVRIDAATALGAHGSALARSTVSDLHGEVGCTAQTLVLAPAASLPDR